MNTLIAPGGYVDTWLRNNDATDTLVALYRSAYPIEATFGFAAQQISGAAQLVTNTKGDVVSTVGMSMAPPLWIVNFALIYAVSPSLAAAMPAYCSHPARGCRGHRGEPHGSGALRRLRVVPPVNFGEPRVPRRLRVGMSRQVLLSKNAGKSTTTSAPIRRTPRIRRSPDRVVGASCESR